MSLSSFVLTLTIGIAQGMLLYMPASGLSLIRAGMGFMNFGQGAFYIMGALVCYYFSRTTSFGIGLVLGFVAVALTGLILEALVMPVYGLKGPFNLLLTMGFSYVVCDILMYLFGNQVKINSVPKALTGTIKIPGLNVILPIYYLFIIALSSVIAIAFWVMFERTKLGIYFRAIISDRYMVENLGINVNFLFAIMFIIGVGLSGIAGALNSPISGLSPKQGLSIFGSIMPTVMIGGMTNLKGTLPAAIVLGIVNAFAAIFMPTFYNIVPYLLMTIVMIFRPHGLFTKEVRK